MSYDLKHGRDLIEKFNRAEVNFAIVAGELPSALDEIERLNAILVAQEERVGPRIDDDPVEVAKRWNGNSGSAEPDFDMSPEDTASFLAAAVLRLDDALAITRNSRETNRRKHEQLRALGRQSKETLADYVARLDQIQDSHLECCHDCNYDKECVACCADGDGGHNCNCYCKGTDHGYGHFLHTLLRLARAALEAGVK